MSARKCLELLQVITEIVLAVVEFVGEGKVKSK